MLASLGWSRERKPKRRICRRGMLSELRRYDGRSFGAKNLEACQAFEPSPHRDKKNGGSSRL